MKPDPEQLTTHHIYPTSRQTKGIRGLCQVVRRLHELYHSLFANMIPEEIVEYLNRIFWNSEFEITIKRKKKC